MKFVNRYILTSVLAVVTLAFTSCITENSVSNKDRESVSLRAWIQLNRPDLLNNYQVNGDYYVEVLEEGGNNPVSGNSNEFDNEPIMDQDTCWVFYDVVGRDMNGRVCLTRDGSLAELSGTFSYMTHYVPFLNYAGSENQGLLEGTYLAMRNELKIGDKTLKLRRGSKVRLYLPSSIAYGESGSSAEGGYEGQYSLDGSRSMIMEIDIKSVIKNPSDKELDMVEAYTVLDGWTQAEKAKTDSDSEDEEQTTTEDSSTTTEDNTLKGLYYRMGFNPKSADVTSYRYVSPEKSGFSAPYRDSKKYADMNVVTKRINEILLERFGEGLAVAEQTDDTKVDTSLAINVWYVLRFLDGFVADTNIKEIREYLYNDKSGTDTPFIYRHSEANPDSESSSTISAWYYTMPNMHYDAYGEIITTSGYAYGIAGISASTTTEESSNSAVAYDYYNYYNYYNSYYGGYGGYYNYYNYPSYYYDYSVGTEDTTVTTTISTEILPYTPLVFTIFVERN